MCAHACTGHWFCLQSLPAGVLSQYEDPESTYSVGWSHGQEAMRPGCRDLLKGSFYANPTVDLPQVQATPLTQCIAYGSALRTAFVGSLIASARSHSGLLLALVSEFCAGG